MAAPVSEAASRVLPGWAAAMIALTAIAAAATSVNAVLLAYSRDILALARVGILPEALRRISPRHGEPTNAVLLITGLCLAAVLVGARITEYAVLSVVGLLVLQLLLGLAALRLPRVMEERYASAGFRLSPGRLRFFAVGLMLCSVAFLAIVLVDSPTLLALDAGYVVLGLACFGLRRASLARRGVRIRDLVEADASGPRQP